LQEVSIRSRSLVAGAVILVAAAILPAAPVAAEPDQAATVGLVDPATGIWRLRAENGNNARFFFGNPGDYPFSGDWDCDGVDTPGLYRRSDGFVYLRDSNTQGIADHEFFFGDPGDIPLAGDFDGDACDTVSLYRPNEGRVYVINRLGDGMGGLGGADFSYYFGNPDDKPFSGDFDGDGVDTVGLHREATGFVYLRNSNTQGIADLEFFFGNPGDRLFAGDWNRDGVDTVGVFRPSDRRVYLRNSNSPGIADVSFAWGDAASLPVAGTFHLDLPLPPPALSLSRIAGGLSSPLFVTAPRGDSRLYVVEQGGDIEVLVNGVRQTAPFLRLPVYSGGEHGLLGLAFHPDYQANGKFYVYYSTTQGVPGGFNHASVLAEYRVSADANLADPASKRVLLTVPQPSSNHNGGMLAFGPDGYLYVGLGDGGGAGCPNPCTAKDPSSRLGAILRIDVNSGVPYSIPAGNPFVAGGAPEVWAYGVRNPWRFSFDPVTNLLYLGDVGQGAREEIDIVDASMGGYNFGWDTFEGTSCYEPDPTTGCAPGNRAFPQLEYSHAEGCSVTGGFVYRGGDLPGLAGHYFYGDFCRGWIRSFRYENGTVTEPIDWTDQLGTVGGLASFGIDGQGEMYIVSLTTGEIYRLSAAG
jgi:glucose/arabinose dehydrogenase